MQKPINLLYTNEYLLLSNTFLQCLSENQSKNHSKSELNNLTKSFITATLLLSYDISTSSSNLDVDALVTNWKIGKFNLPDVDPENISSIISLKNKQKLKILLRRTYRLIFEEPGSNKKLYYMGYRSSTTHPVLDNYYSSSQGVKELRKKHGSKCFNKKILGAGGQSPPVKQATKLYSMKSFIMKL